MSCLINDLSLARQYSCDADFLKDVAELLRLRQQLAIIHDNLYCSRNLGNASVTAQRTFAQIAMAADKNLQQQILLWINRKGPFWDEQRSFHANDYFELGGIDVTDLGVGEAARRTLLGSNSSTWSFPKGGFDTSPLSVQHGLSQAPLGQIELPNFWQIQQLKQGILATLPRPNNWQEVLLAVKARFPNLVFSDEILLRLQPEPFSEYVTERIFELLGVLQAFLEARHPDGSYSERNNELIAQHFSGGKAWFTDESASNKRNCKSVLTWTDPENAALKIFAPWHGKIKTPQFRIHFSPWPLSPQDKKLKVLYIGPKLTKD